MPSKFSHTLPTCKPYKGKCNCDFDPPGVVLPLPLLLPLAHCAAAVAAAAVVLAVLLLP
jgi:hypothetical protein